MNCTKFKKIIPLFLDGNIDKDDKIIFEKHLGSCADCSMLFQKISDSIKSFPLVAQVSIFDVYTGGQVPPGKKSLAYRISFQSPTHTLTDDEVNGVQQQILDKLSKDLRTTLRA